MPGKELFAAASGDEAAEITAIAFVADKMLLVAVGSSLCWYDLDIDSVLIVKPTAILPLNDVGDVNSITFDGTRQVLLSCDEGLLVVSLTENLLPNISSDLSPLKHHSAFVTCAASRAGKGDIVSAGFDCKIVHLDGTSKHKMVHAYNLVDAAPQANTGDVKQLFNPPYIHCLALSPTSPWLVAATGKGSLELIHLDLKYRAAPIAPYSSAANFVLFQKLDTPSDHPHLVSSSISGVIMVHSFQAPPEESQKKFVEVSTRQQELLQRIKAANKISKPQQKLLQSFESQLKGIESAPKLTKLLEWNHPAKINWLCAASKATPSGNLFVADITNDITCYTLL